MCVTWRLTRCEHKRKTLSIAFQVNSKKSMILWLNLSTTSNKRRKPSRSASSRIRRKLSRFAAPISANMRLILKSWRLKSTVCKTNTKTGNVSWLNRLLWTMLVYIQLKLAWMKKKKCEFASMNTFVICLRNFSTLLSKSIWTRLTRRVWQVHL